MAESLGRSVSAQENNVAHVDIREEYECTICLNWLNEPVVTSCGHRFCKACILSWLKKDESRCPIDNKLLDSERDIFVDNFTKRQIDQLVKPCPNSASGCTKLLTTNELEGHLSVCVHNPASNGAVAVAAKTVQCTFYYCGCLWKGLAQDELEEHLKHDLNQHLEMLVTSFRDGQNLSGMDNPRLWDAPPKRANGDAALPTNHEQMDLIRGMYDRIVVLEQQFREQTVKLDKISEALARTAEKDAQRFCDGVLVWRVTQFRSKVDSMRNNPNVLLYSHEAFTSPHGYKFCFRINIAPKCPRLLNLHFHLMQSENDYHLEWPFKGRIKIQMIHPHDFKLTQSDTIMSKQEIQAFYQPQHRISPRGFGFTEYAFVQDMFTQGFVDGQDTVTFKIQVSLV